MKRAAAILALLAAAAPAHAYWTAQSASGGGAAVAAGSLPQANAPTASAVGPSVTVQWQPTSFAPSLGYSVQRYASSGGVPTGPPIAVGCTPSVGAGGALTCSDPAVTAGLYQYTVTATLDSWRGPESTASAPVSVYTDTTPPTTSATLTPATPASGWYAAPVDMTLSAIDNAGGSGVAAIRYTLDGSDPRTSATAVTYAASIHLTASTTVKFAARDNANLWETPQSQTVQIDTTPPANALTLSNVSGGAFLSGNTVFYMGAARGSFTLTNAVADTGGSGAGSSATSALGGTVTGWTHTPGTVTAPAGGPYVSAPFSWSRNTTSTPTETVTGADVAGNTSATTLTFRNDSVAPTTAFTATPAAGWTNGTVTVSLSATDNAGGAGVDHIAYTTDGSDPTLSGSAQTYGGPLAFTSATQLRFAAVDKVGNWETPQTQPVQVDNQPPSPSVSLSNVTGNALLAGTTVFYRGAAAGSFTLTNTATDSGGSGVASSATSALAGTATGWSHTASAVSAPAGGPFVSNPFSWMSGTTSSPTESLTTADAAGNTQLTTLAFVNDSVAPTGSVGFPSAGAYSTGSGWAAGCATAAADICGTVDDGTGAGVASVSVVLTRASDGRCWVPTRARFQPSGCTGVAPDSVNAGSPTTWSLAFPCAVDAYTLDVTLTDALGNARTLPRVAWQNTSCTG